MGGLFSRAQSAETELVNVQPVEREASPFAKIELPSHALVVQSMQRDAQKCVGSRVRLLESSTLDLSLFSAHMTHVVALTKTMVAKAIDASAFLHYMKQMLYAYGLSEESGSPYDTLRLLWAQVLQLENNLGDRNASRQLELMMQCLKPPYKGYLGKRIRCCLDLAAMAAAEKDLDLLAFVQTMAQTVETDRSPWVCNEWKKEMADMHATIDDFFFHLSNDG